ncbi:hypothetical protein K7432_013662 [Basidiobolus ranarum]|uniref:Uncharacterized protein n=1 Tax=Basidiobolus ranarum TaxID=34480 RepID=A0ABR2WIU7_9FUNG
MVQVGTRLPNFTFPPIFQHLSFTNMAQKPLGKKSSSSSSKKPSKPKRGIVIPPKKQTLVKQRKVQQKLTSNINKNIETIMATRAGAVGKLTIMKGYAEPGSDREKEKKMKQ